MQQKTRKTLEIGALVLVLGSVFIIAVAESVKLVINKVNQDRVTACKRIVGQVAESVNQYRLDEGKLPTTLAALSDGKNPKGDIYSNYHENGVRKTVVDPWGRPFVYFPNRWSADRTKDPFTLYSVGTNGIDENGMGDDVTSMN